jgi:hypothetical protein
MPMASTTSRSPRLEGGRRLHQDEEEAFGHGRVSGGAYLAAMASLSGQLRSIDRECLP